MTINPSVLQQLFQQTFGQRPMGMQHQVGSGQVAGLSPQQAAAAQPQVSARRGQNGGDGSSKPWWEQEGYGDVPTYESQEDEITGDGGDSEDGSGDNSSGEGDSDSGDENGSFNGQFVSQTPGTERIDKLKGVFNPTAPMVRPVGQAMANLLLGIAQQPMSPQANPFAPANIFAPGPTAARQGVSFLAPFLPPSAGPAGGIRFSPNAQGRIPAPFPGSDNPQVPPTMPPDPPPAPPHETPPFGENGGDDDGQGSDQNGGSPPDARGPQVPAGTPQVLMSLLGG